MKTSRMFDAMTQIDPRLIDRCLNRKRNSSNNTDYKSSTVRNAFIMRKVFPIACSLVLMIAVALSTIMFAISSKQPSGLKIGFDFAKNELLDGAKIAVVTDKSKVNVGEDLPVSIYVACCSNGEKAPSSVSARIIMSYSRIDPNNRIETVKEIDNGTAAGYTWNNSIAQLKSEETVVPAAVFTTADKRAEIQGLTETDGVVVWALEVNKKYPDGSEIKEQDSVALYYKIEDNEVYLKPSEETQELANTAVEKLQQAVVFSPGLGLMQTLSEVYNNTAKWVAPELITLETKEDSALALIKLYEDLLTEYRSCDLDWFYENVKSGYEPDPDHKDAYMKITRIQTTRMVIEALLALDCYYDLLDERGLQRMMADFKEYIAINNASASKYYDDVSKKTMFEMYRGGGYDMIVIQ